MKKMFLIILTVVCYISYSQSPNWHWAKSGQGAGHDRGAAISADANGNCYATGYFQTPAAVFGSFTLTGSTTFNYNMYVLKYDSLGNVLWANKVGESGVYGDDITTDAAGNSYAVGRFSGTFTVAIGTNTLVAQTASGNGFLIKYSPAGTVLWATLLPATSLSAQNKIAVDIDGSGNSYVAGNFGPPGGDSMTILKYNSAGGPVWQRYATGPNMQWRVHSVATDASGNSYIAGQFMATSLKFGNIVLTNNSFGHEIFVVKYDNAGNVHWATSMGGVPSVYSPEIAVDLNGNTFVTGYYNGNTCVLGTTTLTNSGINDIFLVKLNNLGNIIWARGAGSIDFDSGNAVDTDVSGNVYLTGFYKNQAATFGTVSLPPPVFQDIYVVKYDPAGTALWGKTAGGQLNDVAMDISVKSGKIYITGEFNSTYPVFGTSTVTNCDVVNNPYEVVIAKLGINSPPILTGVDEQIHRSGYSISPQPFSEKTVLTFNQLFQNAIMIISDGSGRQVKIMSDLNGQQIKFSRGNLPPGIYFFRMIGINGFVATGKLVVTD